MPSTIRRASLEDVDVLVFVYETPAWRIFLYATTGGKPIYEKAGF